MGIEGTVGSLRIFEIDLPSCISGTLVSHDITIVILFGGLLSLRCLTIIFVPPRDPVDDARNDTNVIHNSNNILLNLRVIILK